MVFQFQNDTELRILHEKDPILRTMLQGINVPLCCCQCKWRTLNRISDLTLADFWGIDKICPEMFDNKGTSLVLVQSSKGKKLFSQIKSKCRIRLIPTELAIKYNPNTFKQKNDNKYRNAFFKNINKYPLEILTKKCHAYGPFSKQLYKALVRKLKKIKFILMMYRHLKNNFRGKHDT
jgi:hypothetical protein